MDAIELLKKDHQEVTKLFQRFRRGASDVLERICNELEVHTQIEEEIFYPAVSRADAELAKQVEEALREHSRAKSQIKALRQRRGSHGADVSGQVSALEQDIEHHVTEEEGEMFPRVAEVMEARERAELGRRLSERKQELAGGERRRANRSRASSRRTRGTGGRRTKSTRRRQTTRTRRRTRSTAARRGRARSTGSKSRAKKQARGGRGR